MARPKCLALLFSKSERNEGNVLPSFLNAKVDFSSRRGNIMVNVEATFFIHLAQLLRTWADCEEATYFIHLAQLLRTWADCEERSFSSDVVGI